MKLINFDFRVWSAIDNTYLYNPSLTITHFKSAVYKNAYSMEVGEVIDENKDEREVLIGCLDNNRYKSVEIELWSGFYDKNGKKIYEGDIVCFKNRGKYNDDRDEVLAKHIKEKCLKKTFLAQIFFKNEGGGYCIKRQTKRGHTKYFSLFDMSFYLNFRLEVLGNIHENAKLSKEKVLIKCKYGDMYDSQGFPKY